MGLRDRIEEGKRRTAAERGRYRAKLEAKAAKAEAKAAAQSEPPKLKPSARLEALAAERKARGPKPKPESVAQLRRDDTGTPHCPRCGGTNLRARRSRGKLGVAALTAGVGAVLTRRNEVECQTCKHRTKLK